MKALFSISFFLFILTGCTKENVIAETEIPKKEATITYMGNPAADGLGWVLKLSDQSYEIPTNLSKEYEINGLNVKVAYKKSSKTFPCRCAQPKYMVDIISIERNS